MTNWQCVNLLRSKNKGISVTFRFGTILLQTILIVFIDHSEVSGFCTYEIRSRILLVSKKNPPWIWFESIWPPNEVLLIKIRLDWVVVLNNEDEDYQNISLENDNYWTWKNVWLCFVEWQIRIALSLVIRFNQL